MKADTRVEVMICLAQGDGCRGMKIDNDEVLKLAGQIGEARLFISPRATVSVMGSCQLIEVLTLTIFHLVFI